MKHVFGPVPSRRLGRSLGVDPVPFKTCNWNCVYCQLGYTAPLSADRRAFYPVDDIVAEIKFAVLEHHAGEIDWITFAGSGEPTLHSGLGRMIREVRAFTETPVALITNGSLLYRPEVREEVEACDVVLPSLDAGSEELYLKIVRPHREFTFDRLVEGLIAYRGRMWVEVMLIAGVNDTPTALADLARVLDRIQPDEIHVNTPVRPPAVGWVEPPAAKGLERARALLGGVAPVVLPESRAGGLPGSVDEIVEIMQRHPLTDDQVRATLAAQPDAMQALAADPRAQVVVRGGTKYWCGADGAYV